MPFELHIRRAEGREAITIEEWEEAVRAVEGVRMSGSKHGRAEVFVPKFAEWIPAFTWSPRGSVSFKSAPASDSNAAVILHAAFELAKFLNARVVGENDEPYDR